MIIEFTAVPGSGKSYLSKKLTKYLSDELNNERVVIFNNDSLFELITSPDNRFFRRIQKAMHILYILDLNTLKLLFRLLKLPTTVKDKKAKAIYALNIFLKYYYIDKISKNEKRECVFIIDEGLLHLSSIFFDDNSNKEILSRYFNKINKMKKINYKMQDKIYIFIDSNIKENFKRINNRKQGWPSLWANLSDEEKRIMLEKEFTRHNDFKEYIKTLNAKSVVLDNNSFSNNHNSRFKEIKLKVDKLC